MRQGFLLPLLVGRDHGAPRIVLERNSATRMLVEIVGVDLAAIDQCQRQAVGQQRPELLHQVGRQRDTPGTQGVKEADLRIEADAFQRRAGVIHQHRVEEGQQCEVGKWIPMPLNQTIASRKQHLICRIILQMSYSKILYFCYIIV